MNSYIRIENVFFLICQNIGSASDIDLKSISHQAVALPLGYCDVHYRRKEENIIFNDGRNTVYLRLYGVIHMIKDHSDSERGNPLPPLFGLLFPISSKGAFICTP